MKTRYKHINFTPGESLGDDKAWFCHNNKLGTMLGMISYYPPWKRFVFEGQDGCVFDVNCLTDIIDFIKQL